MWGNLRHSLANAADHSIQNIQRPGNLIAKIGELAAPPLDDDEEYYEETESDIGSE